jgi:hypothetical protein
MSQQFPFPPNEDLTAISMAFKNDELIADQALPYFDVSAMNYKFTEFDIGEGFTVPETRVGRTGRVNRVSFTGIERQGACTDHGLEDVVPLVDALNDPNAKRAGMARERRVTQRLVNLIVLARELRVAGQVFDPANYLAANKRALAGAAMWSDPGSDPIGDMRTALDSLIKRPNTVVFGRPAFSAFATHPAVVKAVNGTSGDSGFAKRKDIAELLEVKTLLVGEAFVNSARKGEELALERCWGPHVALYYLDELGGPQENPSFGFSARFTPRQAWSWPDRNAGLRGGTAVRVGESVDEKIVAPALGYLIQNAAPELSASV